MRDEGAPFFRLYGETEKLATSMGLWRAHLSLTHTETFACAFVVLEGDA